MSILDLTDERIAELLRLPKRVVKQGRRKPKEGHFEFDYEVASQDGTVQMVLFVRQNASKPRDFSCGLRLVGSGSDVILVRYNGPSHGHRNKIERERFEGSCHIHRATQRYLELHGSKDEGYAEVTSEYTDVQGALTMMVRDCAITGLRAPDFSEQLSLEDS